VALVVLGCRGEQAVLAPAGPEAAATARISLVLFVGGTAVLALVVLLTAIAVMRSPERRRWLASERTVIWGGLVFPIVVLTGALAYGLSITDLREEREPPTALTVEVEGLQWWWRVRYLGAGGEVMAASANEVRLPVGEPVLLRLTTVDVIHSLWVPNLAGKLDMLPGHVNHLRVQADRPGVFRGQCAEYCGGQHAWMAFHVVAMPPAEHARWLRAAARPPSRRLDPAAARGSRVFLGAGCGACHAVRGTPAEGTLGPDLTRVGERPALAAGRLPNHRQALAAWLARSQQLKPGNGMPSFGFLAEADRAALVAYLESLR
jgi:cytochrome c oxidase subunit 2